MRTQKASERASVLRGVAGVSDLIVDLPFAMVGGVFALMAWALYLSVPDSVGSVVLFGVAVLNGLVLVSYISQLRSEGASVSDAVIRGCEPRLRAVLMTASIAIVSLIPQDTRRLGGDSRYDASGTSRPLWRWLPPWRSPPPASPYSRAPSVSPPRAPGPGGDDRPD